ncbi:MAG: aldo/keto reductase [Flavobacteriaceae bacterium]|nr:aldo/keto reductase [Flavobacteriaceae bacterium]
METYHNKFLIFGCMGLGGSWDTNPISKNDQKKAFDVIHTALENNITFFDHADIYMLGKAEKVFGMFLQEHPHLREKLKIQSKSAIQLHEGALNSNRYNASKEYLIKQVEAILKRLQTDYLDVFLVHRPDPLMNPSELAETFYYLKEKGYVNHFGVSNMSATQIEVLQKFSDIPIKHNQIQFSLGHSQLLENEVFFNTNHSVPANNFGMLAYAQLHNIEIQTYGSLDKGLFSNHQNTGIKTIDETKQLLHQLSEKYQTNILALQLAWIAKLPCKIVPIIGTTNLERIKQCAEFNQIELSREDWYDLWITAMGKKLP